MKPHRITIASVALSCLTLLAPAICAAKQFSIVVAGLGGEAEYTERFQAQAKNIAAAARHASAIAAVTELTGERATRDAVRAAVDETLRNSNTGDQVAIVFVGHGSFDGEEYRFNVAGPDITSGELRNWLEKLEGRRVMLVLATSASGGAIAKLQSERWVLVTATKSGSERNLVRFGEYWAQALNSGEADRDKNEWVTAQEAFEFATRKVADDFKSNASLATEHARLEGKYAESIALGRLGDVDELPNDNELVRLFAERTRNEEALDRVKAQKSTLDESAYYAQLERELVSLARTQRRIDMRQDELRKHMPAQSEKGQRDTGKGVTR